MIGDQVHLTDLTPNDRLGTHGHLPCVVGSVDRDEVPIGLVSLGARDCRQRFDLIPKEGGHLEWYLKRSDKFDSFNNQ